MGEQKMKVVRLKAVNIKKIKEAEIVPNGNLVLISGKNGQGKTSMMDCLLWALAGKKEIQAKPIRAGEEKGEIELDLGELKVVRTFTENDTYLRVFTKEGAEYPNAQQKLSDLIQSIYFDPLKFASYSAKEQKEMLLRLLGVNILDEEMQYTKIYEERTMTGRLQKQLEGELAGIKKPEIGLAQKTEVSVVQLSGRLTELQKDKTDLERAEGNVKILDASILDLEEKLKVAKETLEKAKKDVKRINTLSPKVDDKILAIQTEMRTAEATNQKIREAKRYEEVEAKIDNQTTIWNQQSKQLYDLNEKKEAKLKAVKMPVTGLGFGADGVTFNEIPFEQLAKSEQIKVSLGIAMAQDSGLKLIRIMDGSLLDSDNLTAVEEMAKERDYQVWIEIVDDSGEVGFYIEDGEVKKTN